MSLLQRLNSFASLNIYKLLTTEDNKQHRSDLRIFLFNVVLKAVRGEGGRRKESGKGNREGKGGRGRERGEGGENERLRRRCMVYIQIN